MRIWICLVLAGLVVGAAEAQGEGMAGDGEFLRRVSLDLIGRIPTVEEVEAFELDGDRERVVNGLLASEEYAAYWGNIYVDTFLGRGARLKPKRSAAWLEYFQTAFEENRAYDQIARELLTAEGSVEEIGATGFLASHAIRGGTLEQVAGETGRLFLGIQVQCAQCHDDPYGRFKQKDFEAFTAFFGHTAAARENGTQAIVTREIPLRAKDRPQFQKRLAKKPALKYAVTQPRFFDFNIEQAPGESRREWLTRAILANDRFAQAAVNRVWLQLFGNPIARPWDDLGSFKKTQQPERLTSLANSFRDSGYDHKALIRAIVLSTAYQRTSAGPGNPQLIEEQERAFIRAAVRPLSADQLFNSIITATDIASAKNPRIRKRLATKARSRILREFLVTFEDDEGGASEGFTGNVPQGLLLLNGQLTNTSTRGAKGTMLAAVLERYKSKSERISALFIATYTRRPTPAELENLSDLPNNRQAFQDFFHALLTSTEFITNH